MATAPTLTELKKEIDMLKRQKNQKMALATTRAERDRLLREINQLEDIKKSPTKLKSFSKTFGKGLRTTGTTLWRGIKRASSNLNRNAPEFQQMSRGMMSSSMDMNVPKAKKQISKTKIKKSKKAKRKKGYRMTDKSTNQMMWDLP